MSTIKCNNRAPTALTEIGNDYKILKSSYLKNDTNWFLQRNSLWRGNIGWHSNAQAWICQRQLKGQKLSEDLLCFLQVTKLGIAQGYSTQNYVKTVI